MHHLDNNDGGKRLGVGASITLTTCELQLTNSEPRKSFRRRVRLAQSTLLASLMMSRNAIIEGDGPWVMRRDAEYREEREVDCLINRHSGGRRVTSSSSVDFAATPQD